MHFTENWMEFGKFYPVQVKYWSLVWRVSENKNQMIISKFHLPGIITRLLQTTQLWINAVCGGKYPGNTSFEAIFCIFCVIIRPGGSHYVMNTWVIIRLRGLVASIFLVFRRTRVSDINGVTRSEQTGWCPLSGIYIYLISPHWLTVLSPDICVMDNPALWLADSDPGLASDWLMGDKIEVTAVIIPCPHHGIPNEQNRIKELKFSWENTCGGSISVLKVASWHQLWKLSHFSKTFKLCSRTALFCKCKNLIYAIRVDK